MTNRVFKDVHGNRVTMDDLGVTWLSSDRLAELGLTEVDSTYQAPISAETLKKQQYDAINAKYVAQRDKLLLTRSALEASGANVTNINTAISNLLSEWKAALIAVGESA